MYQITIMSVSNKIEQIKSDDDVYTQPGSLTYNANIQQFKEERYARLIQKHFRNKIKLMKIKCLLKTLTNEIHKTQVKLTEKGSLKYLLKGPEPSEQSISIKFGHVGEKFIIKMIELNPRFELLKCGIQSINEKGEKKDIDLIWRDIKTNKIYYREAKGNIELDTEKLPAMISKIKNSIIGFIKKKYPDHSLDIGIVVWSIYDRKSLKKGISQIKKCEEQGIKVDHIQDILNITNIMWDETSFYAYMRELGDILFN